MEFTKGIKLEISKIEETFKTQRQRILELEEEVRQLRKQLQLFNNALLKAKKAIEDG